jgi:tetratricopeptide (TPR) repeat protein
MLWKRPPLPVLALLAVLLAAPRGWSEEPDPAATPADTSAAETTTWMEEHPELTPEQQISELNARLLAHPRDAALYNSLGVIYAGRQEWLPARDAFISAVQASPRLAEYHRNLAVVFVHIEAYELALEEFQAYQRLDPKGGPDAALLMGEAYRQAGHEAQAKEAFESALTDLPPDKGAERMRAALALAQLAEAAHDPAGARAALERHLDEARRLIAAAAQAEDSTAAAPARALVATLLDGYISEANLLAGADQPGKAAEVYAKALDLAPGRSDVIEGIVGAYLAAGEKDKAREIARRATEDHPGATGAWLAMGRVAEDAGDLPEAVRAYERALAAGSTRPDLKVRLGNLCLQTGESAAARRYLADVVTDPNTPAGTLYNYAVSLIREQKFNLALGPLRRAVKVDPGLASAWSVLASDLQQLEQYPEAVEAYRQAITLGADARLSYNLGFCLNRLTRRDEAIAAFQEAVRLDPTLKEASASLGRALLEAGRYAEAVTALEAAQQLDPEAYSTEFALGLCHYHQGEYQKAIDSYNRALALKETSAALQNMGLAFDKLERKDEAAKCYAEAKKLKAGGK